MVNGHDSVIVRNILHLTKKRLAIFSDAINIPTWSYIKRQRNIFPRLITYTGGITLFRTDVSLAYQIRRITSMLDKYVPTISIPRFVGNNINIIIIIHYMTL